MLKIRNLVLSLLKKYHIQLLLSIILGYCILLIILSSIPGNSAISSNPIDKILHFGAYGLLSLPLYFALSLQDKIYLFRKYPDVSTLLLVFTFGLLNELHQLFITTRTFNKYDLLANFLGSLLAIIVINISLKIIRLLKT